MNRSVVPPEHRRPYTPSSGDGQAKVLQLTIDGSLAWGLEHAARPDETRSSLVRRLFRVALTEPLYIYNNADLPDPWPVLDTLAGFSELTKFRKNGSIHGMNSGKLAVTIDAPTCLYIWQLPCWGPWYAPTVYRYLLALGLVRCLNDGITDGE